VQNTAIRKRGFTLVELLVVIAIIGVLVALLLPAVQAAREAARRTQCSNNLKQLALGLHNYHDTHRAFPLGGAPNQYLGYAARLLPFIEQQPLYDRVRFGEVYSSPSNYAVGAARIDAFFCPSASVLQSLHAPEQSNGERCYTIHYYANSGPIGTNPMSGQNYNVKSEYESSFGQFAIDGIIYYRSSLRMADVTDGTSNTIALGEISWNDYGGYRAWHRGGYHTGSGTEIVNISEKSHRWPINIGKRDTASTYRSLKNDGPYGSQHPGGAMFALCDGSIRFLSETVDHNTYLSLASRNGGEVITEP